MGLLDRKSTRLNSSHVEISYAVFCLKKKKRNHRYDAVYWSHGHRVRRPGKHAAGAALPAPHDHDRTGSRCGRILRAEARTTTGRPGAAQQDPVAVAADLTPAFGGEDRPGPGVVMRRPRSEEHT